MTDIQPFHKLVIHFDTEVLPAPFCHRYRIAIQREEAGLFTVSLDLEYYGREELTEEEILEEGFSYNDDYQWKGDLPMVWGAAIDDKIKATSWKRHAPTREESSLYLRIRRPDAAEDVWPADKKQWETFAQELIQAIFELGKKEAPLTIQFLNIENAQRSYSIEYKFAERTVSIHTAEKHQKPMDWHEGQRLLKYIFSFDYLPEDAIEKPKKPGNYISPGDGLWYDLSIATQKGDSEKLQRLVETLKGYL